MAVLWPFVAVVLTACGGNHNNAGTIAITPPTANVSVGQQQPFEIVIAGNEVNSSFTWQVNGITGGNSTVGTISDFGLFTAPASIPNPPNVTVTAISKTNPAQAPTAAAVIGPLVTISPTIPIVETYATQQFSASVTGTSNTAVTWQVSCSEGGAACGAISQSGLFRAPNSVPTKTQGSYVFTDTVTVTATSQAASAFSGSTVAFINSLNQSAQTAPIQLGASGSNANSLCVSNNVETCFVGTLGALVTRTGNQYVLSNEHVLTRPGGGIVGEAILQPGLFDTECGATPAITAANLSQFTNVQTDNADAAIAQVVSGAVDAGGAIQELGSTVVNGVPQPGAPAQGVGIAASVSELVAKSGRSTGLTCASVEAVSVSSKVQYPLPCSTVTSTVNYSGQVAVGGSGFSASGDSGSLTVDASTAQPVALLFAGDGTTTLGNPVSDVLNALKDASGNTPTFVGGAAHIVAGCSLPPPSAAILQAKAVASDAMRKAEDISNRHAPELLASAAVAAIGVGPSLDAPGEPALLLFIHHGADRGSVPSEVDGVRTRIVESDTILRGLLYPSQTQQLASEAASKLLKAPANDAIQNAVALKKQIADQWMSDPAIQAVGVSASLDSPGEPALIFYILKAKSPHAPIPQTISGVRTRLKETDGFTAGTCTSPRPKHRTHTK